jgi:hydrogenase maturation protein HypF
MATAALRVRVRGVVQGVGFRPFVYRQARAHGLAGWVYNGDAGVEIHLEGPEEAIRAFLAVLRDQPPPASRIAALEAEPCDAEGSAVFEIRESQKADRPTVRISPELAICFACLNELFDPTDRRFRYPYINCTDCGPRYSIVLGLPYDRPRTTIGRARDSEIQIAVRGVSRFHAAVLRNDSEPAR